MDIAHVHIDFLDGLAVDGCTETEHTVGGGVLGTDIDDEIAFVEYLRLDTLDLAVRSLDP